MLQGSSLPPWKLMVSGMKGALRALHSMLRKFLLPMKILRKILLGQGDCFLCNSEVGTREMKHS